MNGDETVWLRRTNVERYAGHLGMALVLPYGENNYYTDNAHGLKWFTYLTQELPLFVRAHFPVSTRRQDTFIAGLSMGGYGACKAALRCPEQYAAFASLSGALDVETIAREYNVNSYWEGLGDCIFHTASPSAARRGRLRLSPAACPLPASAVRPPISAAAPRTRNVCP